MSATPNPIITLFSHNTDSDLEDSDPTIKTRILAGVERYPRFLVSLLSCAVFVYEGPDSMYELFYITLAPILHGSDSLGYCLLRRAEVNLVGGARGSNIHHTDFFLI